MSGSSEKTAFFRTKPAILSASYAGSKRHSALNIITQVVASPDRIERRVSQPQSRPTELGWISTSRLVPRVSHSGTRIKTLPAVTLGYLPREHRVLYRKRLS